MISEKRKLGNTGEDFCVKHLVKHKFRILNRNYRKKWGEIDIIAEKAGIVRFVEVKAVSRESLPNGSREMDYRPEELVHKSKLRKVARTAALYMEEKRDEREFQIDVVGVILDTSARIARCRLFEQALEENL